MSSSENQYLSIRIVTADYYLHKPIPELGDQCYSAFKSSPVYRVPVIRIFGPTAEGVKTCLHVHGVFPYIFVPNWNHQIGEKELYNFATNLDKAINTSFAHSNSKSSHVHKITQVSGTPFYGYHESERNFLKIEFYNPAIVKRASDLLLNGAVLNTIFQPHEAHIPYILQFFIDNNLYGMNNITFSSYKVRESDSEDVVLNLDETILRSNSSIEQQSYSKLEIDITVSNLRNVLSNEENIPNNPGLAFIWEDEKKRRRFNQKSSQITPNESQQRPEKPVTRTECYFREKLIEKLKAIKDNETFMSIDQDETPSLNATYEELNSQSKSLLEILQSLADEQGRSKKATSSGCSSPSLIYSDDENNAAEVSLVSSQPLLQFNAEDDSILGNNFSEDENDIDDQDHRTLSQSITYSKHRQMSSSEDSESELEGIPQLDGACDTKSVKKSAPKKVKSSKSIKISRSNQNQNSPVKKRRYNLRSLEKHVEKSENNEFQPRDFKIILKKLDPPKVSPKKSYPRLNIDTQKSPRLNRSKSSQDSVTVCCKESIQLLPTIPEDSFQRSPSVPEAENEARSSPSVSETRSLPAVLETRKETVTLSLPISPSMKAAKPRGTSNLQKSDKKVYPQLNISIKKSPKSTQKPPVEEVKQPRVMANLRGLKKRKIDFGDDKKEPDKSKEIELNADLISPKWKKSLKRKKKDDTSFKIGDSFSLLQFQKSKKDPSLEKICEKSITRASLTNTCEIGSQNYSLRLGTSESVINNNSICCTLKKIVEENDSMEMERLRISDDEEDTNKNKIGSCIEKNDKLATSEILALPLVECDEELTEAAPQNAVQKNSTESSPNLSIIRNVVLRIPRIDQDILSNSIENSSIELNISEPNENCAKSNQSFHLPTSRFEAEIVSDSKCESTEVETCHKASNDNSTAAALSKNESNSTKVYKKKSLGMRIRKNANQAKSSNSKLNKSTSVALAKIKADEKSVEKLPKILVDQEDDQNKEYSRSSTTPLDSFPDSNIILDITKCVQDETSNSTNQEAQPLKSQNSSHSATSHQYNSNSANSNFASCEKRVLQTTAKVTSALTFEDSQIELDIFKFTSVSFEQSTEETHHSPKHVEKRTSPTLPINENNKSANNFDQRDEENSNSSTLTYISIDEIQKRQNVFLSDAIADHKVRASSPEVLFEESSAANEMEASQSILEGACIFDLSTISPPGLLIDDQNTYFSQESSHSLKDNLNENLAKSPTLFSDDFPNEPIVKSPDGEKNSQSSNLFSSQLVKEKLTPAASQNPTTNADELNNSCSNDSLLNVLESLTPNTKEALNRKLNSFVENIPSQALNNSLAASAASIHCNSKKTTLDEQLFDDLSDDSVIILQKTSARDNNTNYESVDLCTPDILDKATWTVDDSSTTTNHTREPASEEVLFEEDSFDLELSAGREDEPVNETPALNKLLLNNSIWDSIDDDEGTQEDNEIQSFYHNQTINPAHVTIIRDIEDDSEDSSPIAKVLTPESQTSNEILSFYGSQSPESTIYSISQDVIKAPEAKSTPSTSKAQTKSSYVAPHSTPSGSSIKKTPSPLYTPVLKKLMMKKVNDKERRRISSQRFQNGPFLSEIAEEEEDGKNKKEVDRNTSFSLPPELECDISKIDGKSFLNTSKTSTCSGASYQIDGVSLENTCGFKMNLENLQDMKVNKEYQFITLISLEIFTQTRGDLKPDPEYDAISCLFYSIHHDAPGHPNLTSGIITVSEDPLPLDLNRFRSDKIVVSSEAELFDRFLAVIRKWDPDMFIGYEVEMLSWGFLIQRGYFLGRNLSQELSRVRETKQNQPTERPAYEEDEYNNEIKLPGRIVLNVWRLMRHEVNLQSYTFENILFHVLHQRVPYHSFKFLTECWKNNFKKYIVVDYFLLRVESNITLLEQLDFIGRTSELAKLFGIQFYEVLSRGSQFRVESMMLRLAKTQNYVAVSPSVRQRAHMRAPESLPLIMEPESKFYTDPIIVLDFQSLYPSIIIAYNYCFSTCLGRINSLGQNEPFHFGCVEHTVPNELLIKLENSLNLSPAGVAYVDKTIRKGILPSMLEEILETRLMVKRSMKENKNNSILKRVLHARQLGLKLIANVTYGYTSANFSGRMPCMEIADSVVSKGRETLERAIELVNGTAKWGARVVYGDTDSLFVLVPNRSKKEAFRIGSEIADAVTNQNPKPVKLKLEKVYTASILQTKKRYVGYMYESPDQEKPVYDAKGIETVRRDGCPAVSKILEKSLKLLFETKNVNTVKQYVQRQFTKLISGRISIQELTFAREYRGMNNYKPAACVPALQLAKQALMKDRRAEPRVKERVRYVIVTGAPGVPLIRLVRTPKEFLDTPGSLINTEYYITRAIIPALERCFTLMNVNVQAWYTEVPKKQKLNLPIDYELRNKAFKKTTISHYFSSSKCISCSKVAGGSVCRQCEHKPQRLALILGNMINQWQRKHNNVAKICRSCCGRNEPIGCSSLDCPVYYLFRQTDQDAEQVRYAEELKREYLYF